MKNFIKGYLRYWTDDLGDAVFAHLMLTLIIMLIAACIKYQGQ